MSGSGGSSDDLAGLNRLLVTALLALADAGRAEEACRIAARGWSRLRRRHPREAERLTAALHTLARQGTSVPPTQGERTHA
jgi:hypothetical protein